MRKRRKAPRGTKTGTATGGGGLFSSVERLTTHKNQHTKQRLGWPRGKENSRALKSLRGDEFEQETLGPVGPENARPRPVSVNSNQ